MWKRSEKKERGAHAYRTDLNSGMSVLKWYDNKCVQMCSNFSDPAPTSTIMSWDRQENKEIEISCPSVIAEYNTYIGGVDLSDMIISLYHTKFKTKIWYLKIMAHCVDICKVKAWLIYQRYCSQKEIPKYKQLCFLKFVYQIASALIRARAVVNQVGCPP